MAEMAAPLVTSANVKSDSASRTVGVSATEIFHRAPSRRLYFCLGVSLRCRSMSALTNWLAEMHRRRPSQIFSGNYALTFTLYVIQRRLTF